MEDVCKQNISVYNDKVYIWNEGKLPKEIDSHTIYEKHISKPYNPLIANTFYKAGYVESWGRGYEKIEHECKMFDCPLPEVSVLGDGIMVLCNPSANYLKVLNEIKIKSDILNSKINDKINGTLNEKKDKY